MFKITLIKINPDPITVENVRSELERQYNIESQDQYSLKKMIALSERLNDMGYGFITERVEEC